jgi:hypothetical protein
MKENKKLSESEIMEIGNVLEDESLSVEEKKTFMRTKGSFFTKQNIEDFGKPLNIDRSQYMTAKEFNKQMGYNL